jgi:hypothetical protein
VLIVASNAEADRLPGYLPFSRLQTTQGKGYLLLRSYHLCHLEALNTLQRVVADEPILLNNSADPKYTVAAVAKQSIRAGSVNRKGAVDSMCVAWRFRWPNTAPLCPSACCATQWWSATLSLVRWCALMMWRWPTAARGRCTAALPNKVLSSRVDEGR